MMEGSRICEVQNTKNSNNAEYGSFAGITKRFAQPHGYPTRKVPYSILELGNISSTLALERAVLVIGPFQYLMWPAAKRFRRHPMPYVSF